jgi:hypothetical protein
LVSDLDRSTFAGLGREGVSHEQAGRAQPSAGTEGLTLLRAYEPVVRFTKGELFFPTAVAPYVAQCSLWRGGSGDAQVCVVPAGELSLGRLCEVSREHPEWRLSLRFVREPLARGRSLRVGVPA